MLWKKSWDSLLENTSVPHPNFTRCVAGGQARHSTSCCWRKGGEAHPAGTSFPSSLSWLSKANTNTLGLSQPSWRPSPAPSHLHSNLQSSSSLCKTKGKERTREGPQSDSRGVALSFLSTLCHPCPLREPERKRQMRGSCNRMLWRPSSKTLIRYLRNSIEQSLGISTYPGP